MILNDEIKCIGQIHYEYFFQWISFKGKVSVRHFAIAPDYYWRSCPMKISPCDLTSFISGTANYCLLCMSHYSLFSRSSKLSLDSGLFTRLWALLLAAVSTSNAKLLYVYKEYLGNALWEAKTTFLCPSLSLLFPCCGSQIQFTSWFLSSILFVVILCVKSSESREILRKGECT